MTSCSQPTLLRVLAPAPDNLGFLASNLTKSKHDDPNLSQNILKEFFFTNLEIVIRKILY